MVGYRSCYRTDELLEGGEDGLLALDGVDDFAEKLSRLIGDAELRKKLGRNGHVKAAQFNEQLIWDKWEALIKQAMQVM